MSNLGIQIDKRNAIVCFIDNLFCRLAVRTYDNVAVYILDFIWYQYIG